MSVRPKPECTGKAVEHMVEKADAGVDLGFAAPSVSLDEMSALVSSFDFSGVLIVVFPPKSTAMEFACASSELDLRER